MRNQTGKRARRSWKPTRNVGVSRELPAGDDGGGDDGAAGTGDLLRAAEAAFNPEEPHVSNGHRPKTEIRAAPPPDAGICDQHELRVTEESGAAEKLAAVVLAGLDHYRYCLEMDYPAPWEETFGEVMRSKNNAANYAIHAQLKADLNRLIAARHPELLDEMWQELQAYLGSHPELLESQFEDSEETDSPHLESP